MSDPPAPTVEGPGPVRRLASLTVTLILLFGVAYLTLSVGSTSFEGGDLTILTGFVLLVASVAGKLAAGTGLPRLTGFLLVGLLAGPSVVGVLSEGAVADLRLIDEFALALIAMLAGGELKIESLKPLARTIALATLAVVGVVWIGFAGAVLAVRPLLPFLAELPFSATVGVALLMGIWAANSSPDLTVAVMEETGHKGSLGEVILGITVVKDVVVIVLFTLTLALVGPLIEAGTAFTAHVFVDLAREVGGAVVLGAFLGWVFSVYLGDDRERPRSPMATFIFAYVLVVISDYLHVELLLAGVAAGFVIENLSPAGDRMIRGIEAVSVVIFAFFFTIAGASLDLGAMGTFWLAGAILFGVRVLLTWLGTRAGTRLAGSPDQMRRLTWRGLLSQGGVTLGLVLLVQQRFQSVGPGVVALGMAIIIGNILGGPIVLKQALAEGHAEDAAADEGRGDTGTEERR